MRAQHELGVTAFINNKSLLTFKIVQVLPVSIYVWQETALEGTCPLLWQ